MLLFQAYRTARLFAPALIVLSGYTVLMIALLHQPDIGSPSFALWCQVTAHIVVFIMLFRVWTE